jgi:hypothetical protein
MLGALAHNGRLTEHDYDYEQEHEMMITTQTKASRDGVGGEGIEPPTNTV